MRAIRLGRFSTGVLAAAVAAGCGGNRGGGSASAGKGEPVDSFVPAPAPPDPHPRPADACVCDVRGNHGGVLTLAVSGDLGSLHPLKPEGATDQQVRSFIYDKLVDYDNKEWKTSPNLAKGWEVSPDGLVWTFQIRKGVEWADGKPLTADDVIFTFEELLKPEFVAGEKDLLKDSQGRLPTIEKVDDLAVRFRLHEVSALFLEYIGSTPIMPKHRWERAAAEGRFSQILKDMTPAGLQEMIGTGAWRIADYKTAEAIIFERNPRHWRFDRDGKRLPYAEKLVLRIVPSQDTMYVKFIAGDFDLLEPLRPEDYEDARGKEKDKDFTVHALGPSLNTNYLGLNQNPGKNPETGEPYVAPWKLPYFQKTEFRQALSHAMDRQGMVDNLLKGRGVPLYSFTPPGNKIWFNSEAPRHEFDKARSRALLDGLGLVDRDKDGIRETPEGQRFSFTILTNADNTTRIQMGAMIQKDLADVGIEVNVKPISFKTLIPLIQSQFSYEAYILGWASGVPPDPLMSKNALLSSGENHYWHPQQKSPVTPWEADIDRVLGEMSRTVDMEKRKTMYPRIQHHLGEQEPMIFTISANLYIAARNRFRNMKPTLLRPHTYWNHYELAVTRS